LSENCDSDDDPAGLLNRTPGLKQGSPGRQDVIHQQAGQARKLVPRRERPSPVRGALLAPQTDLVATLGNLAQDPRRAQTGVSQQELYRGEPAQTPGFA
jgi:hypothetical protein